MSLPLNKTLQIWFKPATVSHKLHKTDYLYSNTFSFFHFHKDTQAWSCYFIIIESLLDTIWHINYRYTSQAIRSSDRKGLQQGKLAIFNYSFICSLIQVLFHQWLISYLFIISYTQSVLCSFISWHIQFIHSDVHSPVMYLSMHSFLYSFHN